MKFLFLFWLAAVFSAGCAVSQGPQHAGTETPDPDILIAFGDKRCGLCVQNKPTLEAWDAKGRYEVIFIDGFYGKLPVPLYIIVRDGLSIKQTNNINDL